MRTHSSLSPAPASCLVAGFVSKGVKWSKASHVVVFAATVVGHICVCFGNVFGFIIISFHGVSITHISIIYIYVCVLCVSLCV